MDFFQFRIWVPWPKNISLRPVFPHPYISRDSGPVLFLPSLLFYSLFHSSSSLFFRFFLFPFYILILNFISFRSFYFHILYFYRSFRHLKSVFVFIILFHPLNALTHHQTMLPINSIIHQATFRLPSLYSNFITNIFFLIIEWLWLTYWVPFQSAGVNQNNTW